MNTTHKIAQLFTALQFSTEFNGQRDYTTYHVAATSNADAIKALHNDNVNSKLLFLANRDGHGRFSAVEILSKSPESKVSEPDFQRWLATATKSSNEEGEEVPSAWVEVPYISPVVDPIDTQRAELALTNANYQCAIQDGVVIVQDPVHNCGTGKDSGMLVLAGYKEVILKTNHDLRRFFDFRS